MSIRDVIELMTRNLNIGTTSDGHFEHDLVQMFVWYITLYPLSVFHTVQNWCYLLILKVLSFAELIVLHVRILVFNKLNDVIVFMGVISSALKRTSGVLCLPLHIAASIIVIQNNPDIFQITRRLSTEICMVSGCIFRKDPSIHTGFI
jgi:hypothetical protein